MHEFLVPFSGTISVEAKNAADAYDKAQEELTSIRAIFDYDIDWMWMREENEEPYDDHPELFEVE